MKRPLIPVALLYVAGILLAGLRVPLVPLFVVAFLLLNIFGAWPDARRYSLAALVILAGWINLVQRTAVLSPLDLRTIVPFDETIVSVRGVLRETPSLHIHDLLGNIDGVRILLLSGLGREGQLALLSRTNDLHADILVAATDPNATSDILSQTLLDAIHPRVIIINDTGAHSAGEALVAQLAHLDVPVLYTRKAQSITLTTRPGHWQLTATDGTHFP